MAFVKLFIYMARKIYITEDQFRTIIGEMAYPVGFNMKELESLPSYAARVRYCSQRLTKLGQGSSRIVFAVDGEKVLKVAKNAKGVAQNKEEGEEWKQTYCCFARVYDQSEDGVFLEMQAARRAKKSDFKRLTGYDFETMCQWIEYTKGLYSRTARMYGRASKNPLFDSDEWSEYLDDYNVFSGIHAYLCDYQLEAVGDFERLSSWGVVSENGEESLAIIDFGLSDEVFSDYYSVGNVRKAW